MSRKNDPDAGLYQAMDAKVKAFGSYLGSPEQFNSVLFGGLIGSLFSFLQFVASPLIGGMSDLFGRRPLLLLSTAGVAASYAIWATASSFKIFVIARYDMFHDKCLTCMQMRRERFPPVMYIS